MQQIILYIQPQLRFTTTAQDFERVDLMEEDLISLTQVIQDVKSIDKVFTDFSQTFNLPASKTNNKLFKYWYNPDIEGFDNQIMANARIELNHFAFKEGKIRLQSVTMRNNVPSLYKVTFFGNTVTLNDLISEDKLNQLEWVNNFNHANNNTNVKSGLESGLNFTVDSVSYPDAIIYPLIAHSQQYVYDSVGTTLLTGTATSQLASKLVDDLQNFTNVVSIGDVVLNTTDSTVSTVFRIDSNTQLTLADNIMATGENYTIIKANGLNIYASGQNLGKRGVFPEDLKPAILVKHIIKAIEEKYLLNFKTGEFFNSTAMNNLYMWLHRRKGKMALAGTWIGNSDSYTCSGSDCAVFTQTTSIARFTLSNGIIRYVYTPIDDTLSQELTIDFQVTPNSGFTTVPYTIELLNASEWSSLAKKTNQTGTNTVSFTFVANEFFTGEIVGRVTTETAFEFQAEYDLDFTTIVDNGSTTTTNNFTATFTSTASNLSPQTTEVVITDQMPDIKILDFLNGMFKMFNLTAFVNFDGEIVVQKLDDFFAGGDTLDITEFINTNTHTVNNTIPFKEVDLEYAEPKSILAQTFLNTNNRKYGEVEYKSDFKDGDAYKVTAPFEHMLYSRLNDLTALTNTDIQTGCFLDEELNPGIGQPLLFYGIQRSGISTPINFIYNTRPETYGALADSAASGSDIFSLTNYYMPHHANELGSVTTAPSINLNFGSEIDTYNLTDYGGNNNSLFQLNYEDYITDVFSKKARLYKFSAVLPLKILLQLTLDDKIIIGTRLYKINSMTTKLQSGETEFELLNDV
ncbi:MAG: hypothetical protein Unbinned2365contig1001_3 [Prokaryotic dsDNA virus sp.]|nr:MAG: hypothetical protein Unbinned2365contig1001_3 [Prokaryotic dsDNA virus sp.]|tara:strand:- start:10245 stop:12644 length:2400 start_codon:yes stop_codon:yes gene_type:complete